MKKGIKISTLFVVLTTLVISGCTFLPTQRSRSNEENSESEEPIIENNLKLVSFDISDQQTSAPIEQDGRDVYLSSSSYVSVCAQVENENKLPLSDVTLYFESSGESLVFSEKSAKYTCSSTTVIKNDKPITKITINLSPSLIGLKNNCNDKEFVELKVISFLNQKSQLEDATLIDETNNTLVFRYSENATGLSHRWSEWTIIMEPTCTEPGSKQRYCLDNEHHTENAVIQALDHTYDEDYICDRCGINTLKAQVKFMNYDFTLLATYPWYINHDEPQYKGNEPTRADSNSLSYTFVGFEKSSTSTETSIVYVAQFEAGSTGLIFSQGKVTGYTGYSQDIVIPRVHDGVEIEEINDGAFYGNDSIRSVSFPSSMKKIGDNAFAYSQKLKTVTGLENVTHIGSWAFADCPIENLTFGNQLTYIGYEAFRESKITTITLPACLTSIDGAFFGCEKLQSARFEGTDIANVGRSVFENCTNLTTASLPSQLKAIGENWFCGCEKLANIVLPDSLEIVGPRAFCMTKINIESLPTSLKRIESGGFDDCTCINHPITMPDSLEYIGSNAFNNCENIPSFTLNSNLQYIGEYAFSYCAKIESISIGQSVQYIGQAAFSNCDNLETINVAYNNNNYTTRNNILYTKELTEIISVPGKLSGEIVLPDELVELSNLLSGCKHIESVVIPASITTVTRSAFDGCSALTNVTLSPATTTIDDSAFRECESLASIEFPETLSYLGIGVFTNCKSLDNVKIPSLVTELRRHTFQNCTALKTIILPAGITMIDTFCFAGDCLSTVYFEGTSEAWNAIEIGNANEGIYSATKYFYSEQEPATEGYYWHYVDGEPTIW